MIRNATIRTPVIDLHFRLSRSLITHVSSSHSSQHFSVWFINWWEEKMLMNFQASAGHVSMGLLEPSSVVLLLFKLYFNQLLMLWKQFSFNCHVFIFYFLYSSRFNFRTINNYFPKKSSSSGVYKVWRLCIEIRWRQKASAELSYFFPMR